MCICHVTIVLWHAVMYPELKLPGLRLVAPVVGFRKPSAIDAQTSRRGPRRSMKNRDTPAHPQVYGPIRQGLGPCVHDDLGILSPSPCLFGSRRRRGAPFRFSPAVPHRRAVFRTDALAYGALASGAFVFWYHGNPGHVKPDSGR